MVKCDNCSSGTDAKEYKLDLFFQSDKFVKDYRKRGTDTIRLCASCKIRRNKINKCIHDFYPTKTFHFNKGQLDKPIPIEQSDTDIEIVCKKCYLIKSVTGDIRTEYGK